MSNIILTLEADSLDDLRRKAMLVLGLVNPVPGTNAPKEEPIKRPVGRPRKVQPDPLPEIDPVDEGIEGIVVSVPGLDPEPGYPSFVNDRTEPEYVEVPVPNSKADPVAMEKLKQETVAKLPDMFAAGKVNLMRAVLTKYGKGAKSFPEIEAKDFPEIAAALARGDGS